MEVTTNWYLWDIFHQLPDQVKVELEDFIVEEIDINNNESLDILDCGIGTGVISLPIIRCLRKNLQKDINVISFDSNIEKLEILNTKIKFYGLDNLSVLNIDAESDDFENYFRHSQFDACFSILFLHYIKRQQSFLDKISRLLKKRGLFIYGKAIGDIPFLTGQCQDYETVHDKQKIRLFTQIHRMLNTTNQKIISDSCVSESFHELERKKIEWDVKMPLHQIGSIYSQRIIAKNIIDTIQSDAIHLFLKELSVCFDSSTQFDFKFGIEIIIYENHRDS